MHSTAEPKVHLPISGRMISTAIIALLLVVGTILGVLYYTIQNSGDPIALPAGLDVRP